MISSKKDTDKLILEFTNGDIEKYNAVMDKFQFKDAQAFIRFASSVLLETDDNVVGIIKNGAIQAVSPQKDLINNKNE